MRLAFRSLFGPYLVAILCVMIASKTGLWLEKSLGDGFPFAAMIVAVLISGWLGGFGPGLVTSLLGAVSLVYFVLTPIGWMGPEDLESQAGIVLYLIVTIGMAAICGSMRSAVQRAQQGTADAVQALEEKRRLETDRQQLLTELADKNRFIEAVLGQVPVGIAVCDGASGTLMTTNREAERITGIEYQIGESFEETLRQHQVTGWHVDGTPYEPGSWPLQRALRGELVQNEKVLLRTGADTLIHLSVNAGPIIDLKGRVIAAVSVFNDETKRRLSEQQVLESQRFLRCTIDSLHGHIAVLDEQGNILEVNQAWRNFARDNDFQYFAYGVGSNYLAPFENQPIDCGDGATIARGIRSVIEGRSESFEFEYPCHSPNEQRWFLMRVTPFKTPGPRRVVVAHENVTKLREALDLLRDADQRKDEFLATLAHELRNPLAPIHNAVEILKLPQCDAESRRRTLEMVERQTSQLTRLVDDLLDVSRVMRGKIELRLEAVDLVQVIQQALETAGPLLRARKHNVKTQLPAESLYVQADPMRLAQVLSNLLTNAAKYTPAQGVIEVCVEHQPEMAVVRILDNGIGIASDQLHGIFDLFVQVDHATTRSQGGLGIGLTLAKNLVELHQGKIEVSSEGLGRGSSFTVLLPIMRRTPQADRTKQQLDTRAHASSQGSTKILVVDDNRDAANSLAVLLQSLGHQVSVVHSGPAALEAIATDCPQIVFLDIGMPEMDGYEVARRVRANSQLQRLCLAALTGWGQAADRQRTTDAGFDHHIVKPPDLKTLLAVIQHSTKTQSTPTNASHLAVPAR